MFGQMLFQKGHLVGQDIAVRQNQVFDPTRPVRHGQKRHIGLLRRATAFFRIAAEAGADHIFPFITATLRQRLDVVAGQDVLRVFLAAIQAELLVAG